MKTILFLLLCTSAMAQTYDYAEVSMIRSGVDDKKPKILFHFMVNDSVKIYNDMKFPHIINAIQTLELKGYELITITNQNEMTVIVTIAYLRRKRK